MNDILREMFNSYVQKVNELDLRIQIMLTDSDSRFFIRKDERGKLSGEEGELSDADLTILLNTETLKALYRGQMSAMTAAGRANVHDPAPLDFHLGNGLTLTASLYATLIEFIQRFFTTPGNEIIQFGADHSRVVHGANVSALFYHPGFRSAWYQVSKGQQLNQPGDTNPFPQAFVFIKGKGKARIGGEELNVTPGQAVYIPAGQDHIVWTEEETPLELIFLAWGKEA